MQNSNSAASFNEGKQNFVTFYFLYFPSTYITVNLFFIFYQLIFYLTFILSTYLSLYLSVYIYIYLSICLYVYLYVCNCIVDGMMYDCGEYSELGEGEDGEVFYNICL